jgi:ferrous iron transport protein B
LFKVAIAGCANVGKSSLFNLLTGKKNKTGNWDGVTVDTSHGKMLFSKDILIFDLPGIKGLKDHNKTVDQIKSSSFLLEEEIDLIINVVSIDHLKRDLQLSIELYELGKPIIIVIPNHQGKEINLELLNLEFISLNFKKKGIIGDLINRIKSICYEKSGVELKDLPAHYDLMGYNDIDPYIARTQIIDKAITSLEIDNEDSVTGMIDMFVMNRFLAIPTFIVIICTILFLTIVVGEFFKGYFEQGADLFIVEPVAHGLQYIGLPKFVISTFHYGMGPGIKIIASFIPLLFILYIALGILDESGYMTRASIVIGKLAAKVGLSGKSIIPLMVGFGCNVPAIMGARIIENERQRVLTIILIPFMSCGARLTLFALFASSFFPENSAIVICCLYFFSVFLAGIVAFVLQPYFLDKTQDNTEQLLPRYRLPRLIIIAKHTIYKIKHFIIETGQTITIMSIILYWLSVIPADIAQLQFDDINFDEQVSKNSIIVKMSQNFSYIFEPMGITQDNWPAAVSLVTGIIAKEVVASTLLTLYEIQEGANVTPKEIIKKYFKDSANAFAYILFVLIYFPCITVFSVIKKEVSMKVAIYSSVFYTVLAYIIAVSFHQISLYFSYSIPISLMILMVSITIIGFISRVISVYLFSGNRGLNS